MYSGVGMGGGEVIGLVGPWGDPDSSDVAVIMFLDMVPHQSSAGTDEAYVYC